MDGFGAVIHLGAMNTHSVYKSNPTNFDLNLAPQEISFKAICTFRIFS